MPVDPNQQLLHYRLTDKIGDSGMGVVWRARDTVLDREVAIIMDRRVPLPGSAWYIPPVDSDR